MCVDMTYFKLGWSSKEWGSEAQKMRNRKAKELRKMGFDVTTETVSFADLARDSVAYLTAHAPKTPKNPFGPQTRFVHKEA